MSDSRDDFARDFQAALARHLAGGGEPSLREAYELGRRALNDGIGLLEVASVHHAALAALQAAQPGDLHAHLDNAAAFFAECLSSFEMTLLGYRDANRELTELNGRLKREIEERRRAEEALWQTQRLQAVGRLAGGVAHHFNNLLTAVIGNLDLAQRRAAGNSAIERPAAAAVRAAEHGARLTRQLLAFSRQQALHPEVIEPTRWLPDVVTLLRGTLRGNIRVEADIPPALWPLDVDPMELELALLNLGVNARDSMPNGGRLAIRAGNVSIKDSRLGLSGDFVVIEAEDSGCGIPSEILPQIFEPFFTTKEVGHGTGLGLSQVHGFTTQSGGAVDVDSTVGKGTTMRLYLPARRDAMQTNAAPAAPDVHEHPAHGTVLVVDDDVEIADLAAQVLESCGYTVKQTYRACQALDLLQRGDPVDLVFTDIVMPGGMDGLKLAEEVSALFPRTRILLATGYSEALEGAMAHGLRVIPKPYHARELCDCVTGLLRSPAR